MKKLLLILASLICFQKAYMQTSIPQAQSLFIYNFSRLIEWPASYRTGYFVIGILGTGDIALELEKYTKGKKVGAQNIAIRKYKAPEEIQQCHVLVVPFSKTKQMAEIINALNGKSTLIITEKDGALNEGSAINFIVEGDKLKFELKPANANKYGIKFSSKLLEMSTATL
jgi:hypothetical protein